MRRRYGAVLAVFLGWIVVYPITLVVVESFRGPDGWTLVNVVAFVRDASEWSALWNSIWISLASVVLAGVVGVPLAFVFERLEFPGRKVLGALVALPAVLPPLVGVIAFLFLYGESGIIARVVTSLLRLDGSPWRLRGAGAILLVHTYSMYVYFYLFVRAGLAKIDSSMIEFPFGFSLTAIPAFFVGLPLRYLRPSAGPARARAFLLAYRLSAN